jgi:hypothetical protein
VGQKKTALEIVFTLDVGSNVAERSITMWETPLSPEEVIGQLKAELDAAADGAAFIQLGTLILRKERIFSVTVENLLGPGVSGRAKD